MELHDHPYRGHGSARCSLHPIGFGDIVRLRPDLPEPFARAPGIVREVVCTGLHAEFGYWLVVELPNQGERVSVHHTDAELVRVAKGGR